MSSAEFCYLIAQITWTHSHQICDTRWIQFQKAFFCILKKNYNDIQSKGAIRSSCKSRSTFIKRIFPDKFLIKKEWKKWKYFWLCGWARNDEKGFFDKKNWQLLQSAINTHHEARLVEHIQKNGLKRILYKMI